MRNKNVLLIISSRGLGGVEKRFFNLFRHLESQNSKEFTYFFLFHRRFINTIEFNFINNNDKKVNLKFYGTKKKIFNDWCDLKLSYLLLFIKLLELRIKNRIDIVHFVITSSLNFDFLFFNSKKISSFYNGGTTEFGINSKIFKKSIKKKIHIDCLSPNISNSILEKYPESKQFIHTAPCSFINYENTNFKLEEKEEKITFCGRLNEQKGVNLLLQSLPLILDNEKEIKISIIGYGPLSNKIRSMINHYGYENRVKLMFLSDPKEELKKSKIFLSLQKNENYPSQSLLEAMSCGNAVIATKNGLTHLLVNEETGITIDDNPLELSKAISLLFSNKKELEKRMQASRSLVLNNHTVENFVDYLESIYNEL